MMNKLLALSSFAIVIGLVGSPARAAVAKGARTMITVSQDGCGLIDSIEFGQRQVVKAKPGLVGASVTLTPAGKGTIGSLFANEATQVLPAKSASVKAGKTTITVSGSYTDGKANVPFTRRVTIDLNSDTVKITEEADFTSLPSDRLVAKYSLALPLVLDEDPHNRMFAFGGEHRVEMFRMDMNDVSGLWPTWDIGGVLQLPTSYRVWKANHADTMAYPIEEGQGAPGWADYSEPQWGVTVKVATPKKAAPWSIEIDARKGLLLISPYPANQPAISPDQLGKRKFSVTLALHETSWPTEHPCELDVKLYEKFLKEFARPFGHSLAGALGTRNPADIVHKERVQPSVAIRSLYRRDAWRMQALMRRVGRTTPRNQSLEKWQKEADYLLDYLRKNGVPKAK